MHWESLPPKLEVLKILVQNFSVLRHFTWNLKFLKSVCNDIMTCTPSQATLEAELIYGLTFKGIGREVGRRASPFFCIHITVTLLLYFKLSGIFYFSTRNSKTFSLRCAFWISLFLSEQIWLPVPFRRLMRYLLLAIVRFIETIEKLILLWFNNRYWICFR